MQKRALRTAYHRELASTGPWHAHLSDAHLLDIARRVLDTDLDLGPGEDPEFRREELEVRDWPPLAGRRVRHDRTGRLAGGPGPRPVSALGPPGT